MAKWLKKSSFSGLLCTCVVLIWASWAPASSFFSLNAKREYEANTQSWSCAVWSYLWWYGSLQFVGVSLGVFASFKRSLCVFPVITQWCIVAADILQIIMGSRVKIGKTPQLFVVWEGKLSSLQSDKDLMPCFSPCGYANLASPAGTLCLRNVINFHASPCFDPCP